MRWDALAELTDEELTELRQVNKMTTELLSATPPLHELAVEVTRAARGEGPAAPPRLERCRNRDAGGITIRECLPEGREPAGVYLHIHGGGWALGSADAQDPALARIADRTGAVVASVEYRLAPEHAWPAPADDCEAAARWVLEHAAGEWGSDRVVIGGESAGAHLSLVTALRFPGAFHGMNLVYGAYDLSLSPSQRRSGPTSPVISTPTLEWLYDLCWPGLGPEDRRDPGISPLFADLTGLPPALVTVGTADPLLDDSLFLHARLQAAAVASTLRVWPEGLHGFTFFPCQASARANDEADVFVESCLA